MKVYLYCSYSGSAVGFQIKCLDTETGLIVPFEDFTGAGARIERLFTHGGALSAFGVEKDGEAYIFMKSINETDENRRKWFINIAFSSYNISDICSIGYMAYTNYNVFSKLFVDTLAAKSGEDSYEADLTMLAKLVQLAKENYDKVLAARTTAALSIPFALGERDIAAGIRKLKQQSFNSPYEFAVLEGTENYFYTMCGNEDKIKAYVSAAAATAKQRKKETLKKDEDDFSSPEDSGSMAPYVIGVAAVAVAGGILLVRAARKGKKEGRNRR